MHTDSWAQDTYTETSRGIQINLRDPLHCNSNQQTPPPFLPTFPIFTHFRDWGKLSAPTYLKYSVYRENLTALNHFWNFYYVIAKGKDKQKKTFNKYYLNSAQCKTFRRTYVSNNLRNFFRNSKLATSYVVFHSFPVLQWINRVLRAILSGNSLKNIRFTWRGMIFPHTTLPPCLHSDLPREKETQFPSFFNNSTFLKKYSSF